MHLSDPLFITPRMLPRRWGRTDLGGWCAHAPKPAMPVGEIWLSHPHNTLSDGGHFGAEVSAGPEDMLGDLGRAPPTVRLIHTDAVAGPLFSNAPVAVWRILEAKRGAGVSAGKIAGARTKFACKAGDTFLVSDDHALEFSPGVVALEVCTSFQPRNDRASAPIVRLQDDAHRACFTLLRDPGLSVERWTLPAQSYLKPDGETCHVIVPLSDGVMVNGKTLARGSVAFLPAAGSSATLTGEGAQLIVAYPDMIPTRIWRHVGEGHGQERGAPQGRALSDAHADAW